MYKTRITKWGLDKKVKEPEARAVLQLHAQRRGRPTEMRLRGQTVDVHKFEYYFKRKGISIQDVLSSDSAPPSDIDLVCKTPSPTTTPIPTSVATATTVTASETSPEARGLRQYPSVFSATISPRIEAPDGLKTVEYLFMDIREFVIGAKGMYDLLVPPPDFDLISDLSFEPRISSLLDLLDIGGSRKPLNSLGRTDIANIFSVTIILLWLLASAPLGQSLDYPWPPAEFSKMSDSVISHFVDLTRVFCERIRLRLALLMKSDEPFHLIFMSLKQVNADGVEYLMGGQSQIQTSLRIMNDPMTRKDLDFARKIRLASTRHGVTMNALQYVQQSRIFQEE